MTNNLATPATTTVDRTTPTTTRVGVAIAAVLALVDIAGGISQLAPGSVVPPEVAAIVIALGVATAILIPFAWRGAAWAIWLVAALRALSALTALPAFLVPGVPTAAVLSAAASIIVTVAAIVLLLVKGHRA